MRKRFTQEFKQDAVIQVTDKGFPVVEVAERLGVSSHSLYKWVRQYSKHGAGSSGQLNASAEEIRKLKAELRRVTEERDILKKAATYFAKASK
jgi:transposase